jgi:hypothetical protein
MKLFAKNKKNKITAIFIHDGYCWYASVFNAGLVASKVFNISDAENLSPELLKWALEHDVKQVKVAVLSDLHNINMELPENLDMEQTHTAIAWESAELTGKNALGVRHASCKVSALGIDFHSNELITASFKTDLLKNFKSQCTAFRLEFLGVASVQSAFLAMHISDENRKNKNFIFLSNNGVFAFILSNGKNSKIQMRNILFESENRNENSLFKNRFKIKLQHLPLSENNSCIYEFKISKSLDDDTTLKIIENIFFTEFPENKNELIHFNDSTERLSIIFNESEAGNLNTNCPLAILPEVKLGKSGRANIISLFIILAALIYVIAYSSGLFIRNISLKHSYTEMKSFIDKRNVVEGQLKALDKKLEKKQKLYSLMSSGKKENKKFLNFLNALASVIPPEMVLDYIQFNDGSITIQGYVDAQYVFSRFCTDINDELQNINLSVISSSLKHNTLGGKTFEVICEGNND